MDRRQRKTREAIFSAFIALLSQKDLGQITVGEIIEKADVGRATFYAHFPTKDFLLKEKTTTDFNMTDDYFIDLHELLFPQSEHKIIYKSYFDDIL